MKVKKSKVGKVSADGKKARRSVEKEVNSGEEDPEETTEGKETEEEEEEEEEAKGLIMKEAKVNTGRRNRQEVGKANTQSGDLVGKELVDFQNNFNLVTVTSPGRKSLMHHGMTMSLKVFATLMFIVAEPGVLTKPRSQESLSVATEFTKVICRHKHRTFRVKERKTFITSVYCKRNCFSGDEATQGEEKQGGDGEPTVGRSNSDWKQTNSGQQPSDSKICRQSKGATGLHNMHIV